MYKDKFISALITAAGMGTRMNSEIPKLEIKINDKTIIDYTFDKIYKLGIFDEIIIVTNSLLLDEYKNRFGKFNNVKIVLGGETRELSTYNGIKSLNKDSEILLCHDGARPFISEDILIESIDSAIKFGSGVAGVKVKDTIKVVKDETVVFTPDRKLLYNIQTPQTFKTELINKAYDQFIGKIKATDDASFLEAYGESVKIIPGDYKNIKITTEEDLIFFKLLEEK